VCVCVCLSEWEGGGFDERRARVGEEETFYVCGELNLFVCA